ncbi:RNA polymerase sigma factor [Cypionkella aquatica]|uniref:RNA polymerase sigma factor n=1 Tax=Cypionkella aquatica TaxID=1756042 RepID=A0AA37X045_9RHOB|nr:sigma-70 family RNA polymerase sigma factor [Cypionkella aquatica]GLS85310.1 RNA polymerase sigma factor [Cypionkella aquatica]
MTLSPAPRPDADDHATDDLTAALAGCAAGDQAALRLILDQEGGRMLGIAQRMLHRRDLAEEAVQDALVQIWRKAQQFRAGEGAPRAWIFAVLRNRCLNILRDGKRLSTLAPDDLTAMQDARLQSVGAGWDRLGDKVALKDCLAVLEPPTRHAILLAYIGGYSHGEIAALQSVPLGTCKSWIRRGLDALRGCLS